MAVAGRDNRHDARVRHPQPGDAAHPELRVHDGEVIGAHLAGARLVVVRVGRRLDECSQLVVRPRIVGRASAPDRPMERRPCREDLARDLDRLDHLLQVARVAQVVRVHQRVSGRVVARELDPATRPGPDETGQDADRVRMALSDDDVEGHMDERDLQVGSGLGRVRAEEQRTLGEVLLARWDRLWRLVDDAGQDVVVEVLPDAGQVDQRFDADRPQLVRIADPREQQELRRSRWHRRRR